MASPWIQASRPKTLPAAVAPVVVGCAIAWKLSGAFDAWLAVCTLCSALAIQVATNFFNDAIDFSKGADTHRRLGPLRPTSAGLLSKRAVLIAAGAALALAGAFALPMILARGWPILAIGLPSVYFAYGYTGGPLPLAYRGLGELCVLLFFGVVAVMGTVFVQLGAWPVHGLLGGLQMGLLSTSLIAINNLRDVEEDSLSGKRTLAVRLGISFARWEIAACCILPHAIGVAFWPVLGWRSAGLWPLGAFIFGWAVVRNVWTTAPSAAYNRFLALAAAQLLAFAVLLTAACLE